MQREAIFRNVTNRSGRLDAMAARLASAVLRLLAAPPVPALIPVRHYCPTGGRR